jgi:hypothetical protein
VRRELCVTHQLRPPAASLNEDVLSQSIDNMGIPAGERQSPENLRVERDRFVALAFCSADLLVELDRDGRITFAAGATKVFTGRDPGALRGTRVQELIHASDHRKLDRLLRDARAGTRIDDANLTLVSAAGPPMVLSTSGFHMSDLGGHTYLAFRVKAAPSAYADEDAVRVEGMEVYDKSSFTEAATRAFKDFLSHADDDYTNLATCLSANIHALDMWTKTLSRYGKRLRYEQFNEMVDTLSILYDMRRPSGTHLRQAS